MCFSKASTPPPPPVPPPPPAPVVKPTKVKESDRTAKKMAKKRGQAVTNVTGGNNAQLSSDMPVTKKTLLGS